MRLALPDVARLALTALAAALLASAQLGLAPKPNPTPTHWQLDFEVGPLRQAIVDSGSEGPRAYWYLTLRVENNSGRDQFFVPAFDLATANGQIVRAGRGVPGSVYDEMLGRLNNPLLETQFDVQSLLLQGEENARDVLVIWPAVDLDPDAFSVFFIGFSGENKKMLIPNPKTKELIEFVTRKTYVVDYCVPGQIHDRGGRPFDQCGARWVMR